MAGTLERADSGIVHTQNTSIKESEECTAAHTDPTSRHPLIDAVTEQVNDYILQGWNFEGDESSKQAFLRSGVSGLACVCFPRALDDRIWLTARLFSLVFLAGETLRLLDAVDGEDLIEALEAAIKGHWLPSDNVPVVWMFCELFDEMRAQDYLLVDDIVETTLAHLRASLIRRGRPNRREYVLPASSKNFRIGASLLSSLSPFAMGYH